MEKTKLVIGNGKEVMVYELGKPIYSITGEYLPFHGFKLLTDDEARKVLKQLNKHGKGKQIQKSC